jgi:ABC transporter DrrB family efflux protein
MTATHTPRPSLVLDIALMTRRAFTLMRRSPTTPMAAIGFPVILMLFLSVSFADVVMPGAGFSEYVDYSTPLFIAMGITFATLGTAIDAHTDRVSGFQNRMKTLPVSPIAPFAGRAIADLVRNMTTAIVVTTVAFALGFRFGPDAGLGDIVGFLTFPLVYGFGLAWFMLAVAEWMSSAEAVNAALSAVLLVFSFLSTGFVKLEDLPGWAKPIAEANPISKIVEVMRGFASGTANSSAVVGATAWALGMTAVFGSILVLMSRRR